MRWCVGLVLLAGCDYVLGLERNPPDVLPDAPETDAAVGCWTNNRQDHDEDGDRRMDGCDNCPGVFNAQQEDDDGDGVGNRCDPAFSTTSRSFAASARKTT